MAAIDWKVATTRRGLDEAQRVGWQCLSEELGSPMNGAPGSLRDVSHLDGLPSVHHVVVFCGKGLLDRAGVDGRSARSESAA
jgi:hypothetical protein